VSGLVLTEEPLQFGEGGRLSGVLTQPDSTSVKVRNPQVFVFLNAGLMHRVGPSRLHVRLARELAPLGFSSLRVDLAGTGDSPRRVGLTNRQSVAADFAEIKKFLDLRLGDVPLILFGLCSGADNAVRLTVGEQRVIGLVLLDPYCSSNGHIVEKARATYFRWLKPFQHIVALKKRLVPRALRDVPYHELPRTVFLTIREAVENRLEPETLRDVPTQDQLRAAFLKIRERKGRILSVFTLVAFQTYYDQAGQLGRVVKVDGYDEFCTEVFWPEATHTYLLEVHRRRIIEEVKTWAVGYSGAK